MSGIGRARSRFTARTLLASVMLLAFGLPAVARAEPPPPPPLSNDARAEQLFRAGEKKFDGGDYTGACTDFFESLKLGAKLGTLLNLALCHETVAKPVTAWEEFSHAAAWAAQNNQRDRYDFAMQHVRALEPKLPRVILQLPADRAINGLDVDGDPLPEQRWYMPLFLDPGEHRLAITAPGKRRASVAFRVTTSPSDQLVYIPPLDDEKKLAPPPATTAVRPNTMRRDLGLAGLGVGAVAALVGSTFGVLAITADDRDPVVKQRATIGTVGFITGAVFASLGGWLYLTRMPTTAPRTALGIAPHRDGAAAWLTTSF